MFVQHRANPQKFDKLNDFSDRFGGMLDDAAINSKVSAKMSLKKRTFKGKAKAQQVEGESDQGDEYDNEEYDNEEDDHCEDHHYFDLDPVEFLSQQPFEIMAAVLHPDNKALVEYLERDDVYNWVYLNPMVRK